MALTDGLVVEHDCSDFIDSVGSSNASDTSPVGSATTVESIDNRIAWHYSTAYSELTLANPPSLAGDWTIAMWFKGLRPSGYRTATKGSDHQIIVGPGGNLGTYTTGVVSSGEIMLAANYQDWNHIAAVGSGLTTVFYINGNPVGSPIAHKSSDQITNVGNTYGYGQGFAEYIDDFKVWNRALSPTEVMDLFTSNSLADDLVHSFPLNSDGREIISSNNGTVYGVVPASSGGRNCIQFDGYNDHIEAPFSSAIDFGTGAFTISAWFNTNDVYGSSNSQGTIASINSGFTEMFIHDGKVKAVIRGYLVIGGTITTGSWFNAILTRRLDGSVKIYVNGDSSATWTEYAAQIATVDVSDPETKLNIGTGGSRPYNHFGGYIDSVLIWNRELSEGEIQDVYNESYGVEVIGDSVSPVITMIGDNPLLLANEAGQYSDPGASASDNVDGDISNDVVVSGDIVNKSVDNDYFINYNVVDSSGNPATQAVRNVKVISFYQHPEDDTSLDPTTESSGWARVGQNNSDGGSFSWYTISPGDDQYLITAPNTPYSSVFIEQEKTYNLPFAHTYVRIKFDYYHIHVIPNVMLYADGQLIRTFTWADSQGVSISPHPYLTWGQGVVGVDVIIPHTANTLSLKIAGGYAPSQRRAAFSPVEIYVDNPDYATGFVERTYSLEILQTDRIMCFVNNKFVSSENYTYINGSITFNQDFVSIGDQVNIIKVK